MTPIRSVLAAGTCVAAFSLAPLAGAFLLASASLAAAGTYQIDLRGEAIETRHRARVFGTITLDLTQSTRDAVRSSELFYQHESSTPVAFPSLPSRGSADPSDALVWETRGDDLYITRVSSLNRILDWTVIPAPGEIVNFFFEAGPPNNPHGIFLRTEGHDDTVVLKAGSGPDGPRGFFVGVRVPEPTGVTLLAAMLVGFRLRAETRRR